MVENGWSKKKEKRVRRKAVTKKLVDDIWQAKKIKERLGETLDTAEVKE
jgi:hypothetical protein